MSIVSIASFLYRLVVAGLLGAQLFFAAVAAQVVFSREIAARPPGDPLRQQAADAVGGMLARLDAATLSGAAVAVVCAVWLARSGIPGARGAALFPLLTGLCAAASAFLITPAIHALRVAGRTGDPAFGRLHALSAALLVLEMIFLFLAAARAPGPSALFPRAPSL
jgi:hypothetical protein